MSVHPLEVVIREPQDSSDAPPILCVHGILHGAWCYDQYMLPYFAERGRIAAALSLRGHGDSPDVAVRWLSYQDYLDDIHRAVDKLTREYGRPPVLIGHSMGGYLVQKYLERLSVPAAVLLASAPTHGVILAALRVLRNDPFGLLKCTLTLNLRPLVRSISSMQQHFFSDGLPIPQLDEFHQQMSDESFRIFLEMLIIWPRPKRVQTPLLVLGGAEDMLFSADEIRKTARVYGAECTVYENMAHDLMLEPGWQHVADRILNWLSARGL